MDRRGLNAVDATFVIGGDGAAGAGGGAPSGGGGAGAMGGGGTGGGASAGSGGAGGTGVVDAGSGGAGGQDTTADSGASGGTGGIVVSTDASDVGATSPIGCADGTREGYLSLVTYPLIAACAGGWSITGMVAANTMTPQCGRRAGNNGMVTSGNGCSVADLCAEGWHVCETAAEVASLARSCTDAVAPAGNTDVFYATRQRATGVTCIINNATPSTNNLHGCGNFGTNEAPSCAPLNMLLTQTDCAGTAPWDCGEQAGDITELADVTKTTSGGANGSTHGGVLCCHD